MWTYPPSQILVPVDFGDASKRAIELAAVLATRYGTALRLLHAETLEAPAYFTHEQVATIERERQAGRRIARKHVTEFAALPSLSSSVDLVQAPPADAILDAAASVDLVVMGTHGRKGPTRWWLGSVAERVSRDAAVPVLVVRAGPAWSPEKVLTRPLVVAGPHALGIAAARYAAGLAESFGGHVAERTARCEADVAQERNASLIVVARPHATGSWLVESTERMLRNCTLPMLFVPDDQ